MATDCTVLICSREYGTAQHRLFYVDRLNRRLSTITRKGPSPGGYPAGTLVFRHNHLDRSASLLKIQHRRCGHGKARTCGNKSKLRHSRRLCDPPALDVPFGESAHEIASLVAAPELPLGPPSRGPSARRMSCASFGGAQQPLSGAACDSRL